MGTWSRRLVALVGLAFVIGLAAPTATSASIGWWYITQDTTLTEDHFGTIIIAADDITLDGNGFTLHAGSVGSCHGLQLGGHSGVTIRDLRVEGFSCGAGFLVGTNPWTPTTANTLVDNVAVGNLAGFILDRATGNTLARNVSDENLLNGFQIQLGSHGNLIEDNSATGNLGHGFAIADSNDNVLLDNTAIDSGLHGIVTGQATGTRLEGNHAEGSWWPGIAVVDGASSSVVVANVSSRNLGVGLYLQNTADNEVTGNVVNDNGQTGILLFGSGNNRLIDNTANANGAEGWALVQSDGNEVRDNTSNHNVGSGFLVEDSSENVLTANTANGNEIAGFWIRFAADANVLTGNTSNTNFEGIVVETVTGNVFTANIANLNANTGFWVRFGASDNTFEANVARQNGTIDAYADETASNNVWTHNKFGQTAGF